MVPPRTAGRVLGGTWPATIWGRFMAAALATEPLGRSHQDLPEPDGPVPAVVGVPVARAAGWLEAAGLSLVQRLRVDEGAAPGDGAGPGAGRGAARPAGAPVELTVAVDAAGNGGLGVTLVPEVLGQSEELARQLLDGVGLGAEVVAGCDPDPARAAAEPGRVWRSRPAPGAQSPTSGPVRLWVNPPDCPPAPATTTTTRAGAATSATAER